jgi:hypothetical protein
MTLLTLPKSIQNLLIVGPIYHKLDKLKIIERKLPLYDWIIINDSITCAGDNISSIKSQIAVMDQLLAGNKVIYNVGKMDLMTATKMNFLDRDQFQIAHWIRTKSNVVRVNFADSFQLLVMSGGFCSNINSYQQLNDNLEVSFIIHPHQIYTGGLGYVVSNLPLTKSKPSYHNYSAQIGNTVDGEVYALEVNRNGVQKSILL